LRVIDNEVYLLSNARQLRLAFKLDLIVLQIPLEELLTVSRNADVGLLALLESVFILI
jgi:hypothetical protein